MDKLSSLPANEPAVSAYAPCDAEFRWYAAMTQPLREILALEHIVRQGFQAFCPLERVQRHHARKVISTTAPVFRNYVFVRLDPLRARWRSINGTRGVRSMVASGDSPLPVKRGVVETLLASTDDDGILKFVDPLQPGMTVRLRSGPLAEQLGVIERLDGKCRLTLLMDFLGGPVRTAVTRDMLQKVS